MLLGTYGILYPAAPNKSRTVNDLLDMWDGCVVEVQKVERQAHFLLDDLTLRLGLKAADHNQPRKRASFVDAHGNVHVYAFSFGLSYSTGKEGVNYSQHCYNGFSCPYLYDEAHGYPRPRKPLAEGSALSKLADVALELEDARERARWANEEAKSYVGHTGELAPVVEAFYQNQSRLTSLLYRKNVIRAALEKTIVAMLPNCSVLVDGTTATSSLSTRGTLGAITRIKLGERRIVTLAADGLYMEDLATSIDLPLSQVVPPQRDREGLLRRLRDLEEERLRQALEKEL